MISCDGGKLLCVGSVKVNIPVLSDSTGGPAGSRPRYKVPEKPSAENKHVILRDSKMYLKKVKANNNTAITSYMVPQMFYTHLQANICEKVSPPTKKKYLQIGFTNRKS